MGAKCFGCLSLRSCSIFSATVALVLSIACLLLAFFKVREIDADIDVLNTRILSKEELDFKDRYDMLKDMATIMYSVYGVFSVWIIFTLPMSIGIFLEKRLLLLPWVVVTAIVTLYSSAVAVGISVFPGADTIMMAAALTLGFCVMLVGIFGVVTVILYFKDLGAQDKASEAILHDDGKPSSKKYDAI